MNAWSQNALFCDADLDDVLRRIVDNISNEVNQIPRDQFIASTDHQISEHLISQNSIEPLVLFENSARMEIDETEVDVSRDRDRSWSMDSPGPRLIPGTKVTVTIPFSGTWQLWNWRPTPCQMSYPRGRVKGPHHDQTGSVIFTIEMPIDADSRQFKDILDQYLTDTRHHIEKQRAQIEAFAAALPGKVQAAITARRNRLEKHDGIARLLEIPLKTKEGSPPVEPIPLKQRIVKPLASPPASGYAPEPGIGEENYETTLKIIRNQGRTFESTPRTYQVHNEEELRDILLANLNSIFEGDATSETFRKSGKTDICIENRDRVAFVAECKVWRGAKELSQAIDQLLSYLTWRDCKGALVVFNKKVSGFGALLTKVPAVLATHGLKVHEIDIQQDGEWRYVFRSKEDAARLITVHVFLFNIYAD